MPRRDPNRPLLKVTLLAASALPILAGATIAPALPAMQSHFGDVPNAALLVRLVLTLPALFVAVCAPIAGYIVDRIGRKAVIVSSTLLFGLGGSVGYFAPTLATLLMTRAVLGISVAGLITSTTTLIADYYTGEARAKVISLRVGLMGFGATAFLILVGVLAEIGWRPPFLIYLAGLAAFPFVVLVLYEPSRADRCEETPPPVSDVSTCVGEALTMDEERHSAQSAAGPAPVRFISFAYAVMIILQIVLGLTPIQLPFYLQGLTGASASQTGLALSAMTLFVGVASIQYARIASRLDNFRALLLTFVAAGAGNLLLSMANGWIVIALGLLLEGVGLGLLMPNMMLWLTNETPDAMRGRVLGGLITAAFLGQFLAPVVGQPVSEAFGLAGLFLGAGAILVLMIPISLVTRRGLGLATG